MDDPVNQAGPGMPVMGAPASPLGGSVPPPPPPGGMPPPMGGPGAIEEQHEKIIAALTRIEEKLSIIAAKVGA